MERFSAVFVDDEALTLELLYYRIDWELLNVEIVGKFTNVLEAIDAIKSLKPDIVISDINMPYLNGLDFGEIILDIYPQVKLIMLTGYENFSYVRKSLQIGVSDYLLKPICAEEIFVSVQKICGKIREERKEESYDAILTQYANESIWQRILLYETAPEEIYSSIDSRMVSAQNYSILLVEIQDCEFSSQEKFLVTREVMQFMYKFWRDIFFQPAFCHLLEVAVVLGEATDLFINAPILLEKLRETLPYNFALTFSENPVSLDVLPEEYALLQKILLYKFLMGYNHIILRKDIHEKSNDNVVNEKYYIRQISSALQARLVDQARHLSKEYLDAYKRTFCRLDDIRYCAANIIWIIARTFDSDDEVSFYCNLPAIWDIFVKCDTLFSLESFLWQCFHMITLQQAEQNTDLISEKIKSIIHEKYKDYEFSLNSIAEVLCRNPSYISRIFKQQTGENITSYIMRIRMENAKKLLSETSLKIGEIAENIGVIDANYFSICFRKYEGCSPSEYRLKMLNSK